MANERYEVAKKYMCRWLPEEAYSACETKLKGKEPDDIGCLVCMSTMVAMDAEIFWKFILYLGVGDVTVTDKIAVVGVSFEKTLLVLKQVARKLRPEFDSEKREQYADVVEEMLRVMKGVE